MYITDTHTVTLDEAAYEVTKALKESKMGEHTYKTMTASDVYLVTVKRRSTRK